MEKEIEDMTALIMCITLLDLLLGYIIIVIAPTVFFGTLIIGIIMGLRGGRARTSSVHLD
ncbi:MAG TPA: hypothetical protein VGV59_20420 [Pyrinomonadaceae bacterium]|nr:hypothetical protein [Pyrinomonadaceae bacterium]